VRLVVGLGANLGEPARALAAATARIASAAPLLGVASLWRTASIGPPQGDFLNGALLVDWSAHPLELLALCRRLEAEAGRDPRPDVRWGPRPLDLDLLVAEALVIESPALTLPHPRFGERRFALAPAAELVPDWVHARLGRSIAELAAEPAIAGQRCERIGLLELRDTD
jgi:2-amino-4-hydroxy-6-hydroxymethyldihydropteridine diphosphokinase